MEEGLRIAGEWYFYSRGILVRKEKNLVVTSGLNFMAALLVGEQQNSIPFHLAIGTGTAAPTSLDNKLQAEAFRKPVSAKQRQGNVAKFRTFLLQNEANGDWQEFGIFAAGTDQKDSGVLLNRLVAPISKSSMAVDTIECRITFLAG